jgi:hypothetical protein
MADSRHDRYGASTVDLASVREFVIGFQAADAQRKKDAHRAIRTGLLTAGAVVALQILHGRKK